MYSFTIYQNQSDLTLLRFQMFIQSNNEIEALKYKNKNSHDESWVKI